MKQLRKIYIYQGIDHCGHLSMRQVIFRHYFSIVSFQQSIATAFERATLDQSCGMSEKVIPMLFAEVAAKILVGNAVMIMTSTRKTDIAFS